VRHLHTEGLLESIRVAYFFARVGDEDLSISRDLRSHHVHREVFWESAAKLGRLAAFPTNARLESPITGHRAFVDLGFSRVVAITDAHYGDGGDGDASPGSYSLTAEDSVEHCSAESLAAVGEVTLETLDRIAARLSRIDRFRGAPLVDPHTRAGN
jgi:Zn-dependent M28 family amino/carboxypeptidase